MKPIRYTPIGTIRTPFKELAGMPIQPIGASWQEKAQTHSLLHKTDNRFR